MDNIKKTGRPTEDLYAKYIAGKEQDIERWCEEGADNKGIAQLLNISLSTFKRIKKDYVAFAELLSIGGEVANDDIVSSLYKRAKGYEAEETITEVRVSPNGGAQTTFVRKVKKHIPPDTTAAIFWLKNRTKEWSDRQDVTLDTSQPINITIAPYNGCDDKAKR